MLKRRQNNLFASLIFLFVSEFFRRVIVSLRSFHNVQREEKKTIFESFTFRKCAKQQNSIRAMSPEERI